MRVARRTARAGPSRSHSPSDVLLDCLEPSDRTSFCEWKGVACYWSVRVGDRLAKDAAWSYPTPDPGYEAIRDYLAFYPRRMDACYVGADRVEPQPGFYYGGWITPNPPPEEVRPFRPLRPARVPRRGAAGFHPTPARPEVPPA